MTGRSLCDRHRARVLAEQAAAAAPAGAPMAGAAHEIMAAALWSDLRKLKEIKSLEAKIEAKRRMLPAYAEYIAGVLATGRGAQDPVLTNIMTWRLDVGDLAGALDIGEYAIRYGVDLPDRFQRDTPSLLLEQTADEALARLDPPGKPSDSITPEDAATLLEQILRVQSLTEGADMHDQIRAKGYKALGYAYRALGNLPAGIAALRRALELNERCGVKRDIELMERQHRRDQSQPEASADDAA